GAVGTFGAQLWGCSGVVSRDVTPSPTPIRNVLVATLDITGSLAGPRLCVRRYACRSLVMHKTVCMPIVTGFLAGLWICAIFVIEEAMTLGSTIISWSSPSTYLPCLHVLALRSSLLFLPIHVADPPSSQR
uniref:Uncharacterized protein n=1 Tax=Cucumis melo TaxID=3656 RepID=A0A9I9E1H0_CUCME